MPASLEPFKFRQAGLYIHFFEGQYSSFSKGNKVKFEHSIKEMLTHFEDYLVFEYPHGDIPPFQQDKIDEFRAVVQKILSDRQA